MPKLTKRFVDALKPATLDTLYRDSDLGGFGLRLKPSGAATWIVQYRNRGGRTRKLALGKVGVLTPEEARKLARETLAAVAKGEDPSADRHAQRDALNVGETVERYLTEGPVDKPGKKASSWAIDASNLRRHVVPLLGKRQLGGLKPSDVQRFQRDVTDGKTSVDERTKGRGRAIVSGGPGTAARATAVLASMLNWAVARGLLPANPAKGVKLNKLRKREKFLSASELAHVGEALTSAQRDGVNETALHMVRLLLLTGARRNEIASLRWDHVDFERAALRLPDSKTGAKVIPLGAPALDVLARLDRRGDSPWVFPATRGDGHFKGVRRVWLRVAKLASLKGVRLHDLRHGFASVAVADGGSLYLLGKVLGHTQAATTQRYAHLELDPIRALADRTSRKIAGALRGGVPAGVLNVRGRRA